MSAAIEWRSEQHYEARIFSHKTPVERFHRDAAALRIACIRDHAPALRDRIDLAFCIDVRAKWRAVVVVCASIPFTVPRRQLDCLLVCVGFVSECLRCL